MGILAFLPLIQFAGNSILALLAQTKTIPDGSVNLASQVESAFGPLIAALLSHQGAAADVLAGYGAVIGTLTSLKGVKAFDQATIDRINVYLTAAQNGTAAYLQAGKGFDPSLYGPTTPIA